MDSITRANNGSLVSKHTDYIIASVMASNIVDGYSFYKSMITLETIYHIAQNFDWGKF